MGQRMDQSRVDGVDFVRIDTLYLGGLRVKRYSENQKGIRKTIEIEIKIITAFIRFHLPFDLATIAYSRIRLQQV